MVAPELFVMVPKVLSNEEPELKLIVPVLEMVPELPPVPLMSDPLILAVPLLLKEPVFSKTNPKLLFNVPELLSVLEFEKVGP